MKFGSMAFHAIAPFEPRSSSVKSSLEPVAILLASTEPSAPPGSSNSRIA